VWSDGCYSNKQYDAMYEQQKTLADPTERAALIDKMQEFVYQQIPEVVLVYENDLQAYRTDTYTGYLPVPQPDGYLVFGWGPYSYINLKPVAGSSGGGSSEPGVSTGVWVAVAVGILIVAGAVILVRRRRPDEDQA
jgi:peptide/nickel transport system substrate-binding protein